MFDTMPWRYRTRLSAEGPRPSYTMASLSALCGSIRASATDDACQMYDEHGRVTLLGKDPLVQYFDPSRHMFVLASYLLDELCDLATDLP